MSRTHQRDYKEPPLLSKVVVVVPVVFPRSGLQVVVAGGDDAGEHGEKVSFIGWFNIATTTFLIATALLVAAALIVAAALRGAGTTAFLIATALLVAAALRAADTTAFLIATALHGATALLVATALIVAAALCGAGTTAFLIATALHGATVAAFFVATADDPRNAHAEGETDNNP